MMATSATRRGGLVVPKAWVDLSEPGQPRLIAGHCSTCDLTVFPWPDQCSACLATALTPKPLSTSGALYSYSVIHSGPKGWETPYTVGYVDLPEGVRVFAHIGELEEHLIRPDQAVCMEIIERDEETYGVIWRTCSEPQTPPERAMENQGGTYA